MVFGEAGTLVEEVSVDTVVEVAAGIAMGIVVEAVAGKILAELGVVGGKFLAEVVVVLGRIVGAAGIAGVVAGGMAAGTAAEEAEGKVAGFAEVCSQASAA